jgi:glutamine cyclotransferase
LTVSFSKIYEKSLKNSSNIWKKFPNSALFGSSITENGDRLRIVAYLEGV